MRFITSHHIFKSYDEERKIYLQFGPEFVKEKVLRFSFPFHGRVIVYGKGKEKVRKYTQIDLVPPTHPVFHRVPTTLFQEHLGNIKFIEISLGKQTTTQTQTNKRTNIVLIFESTSLSLYFRMPLKNLSLSRHSLKQLESHERHRITRIPVCADCYYRQSEQRQGLNF